MKQFVFLEDENDCAYAVEAENYKVAKQKFCEYLEKERYLQRHGCYEDLDDYNFDEYFTPIRIIEIK